MFEAIYERLREVARTRELITYKEIAEMVGLDWRKDYGKCRQIFAILLGRFLLLKFSRGTLCF